MKIVISGSSGLLGSALLPQLAADGHTLTRLIRSGNNGIRWDPLGQSIDAQALEGHDAVIHLAGENIAGRWTTAKKQRILSSRVEGTRLLSRTLAQLARPPRVLLSASATGFYGHRGAEVLSEESSAGSGFLADVCRQWEAATEQAKQRGVRVVHLRLGVVLTRRGGALKAMLWPFKLGLGGVVGSGEQYWPWVTLDDVVGAVQLALKADALSGPLNLVAPQTLTNRQFTKVLGGVLRRPTVCRVPAFALRLLLGQLADEGLLASVRVEPARLKALGYPFRYPELEGALRHELD